MTVQLNVDDELHLRDVVEAHANLAPTRQVITDRRAVYRLAASLLHPEATSSLADDALDHPVTRFRIGEVLAGRATPDLGLVTTDSLASRRHLADDNLPFTLVGSAEAHDLLAEALNYVSVEVSQPN